MSNIMYYRLNDRYALRGWKGLPYAVGKYKLLDMSGTSRSLRYSADGQPSFFNEEQFETVRKFDGITPVDENSLPGSGKELIRNALEYDIITGSENPLPELTDFQKYIYYPALYVREVIWSVTGKCNYRCRHCILSAPDGIHPEPGIDDCRRIADQLAECGIRSVALTGGEPLVRKDFLQIAEMLTERDIRISMIMTNGRLVTPELLDGLEKLGQRPDFKVSFDGIGYHDSMRGIKGAEEAALSAMRLLVSRDFAVTVSMCIDRESAGSIRETVNLLADIGVESVGVTIPQNLGAWRKVGNDRALSFEESMEIYLEYIPHFFEDGMPVSVELGGVFNCNRKGTIYTIPYVRKFDTDEELQKHLICTSARYYVYISAECRLMPCLGYIAAEYADEFPDILEIPLKDALSESRAHDIMTCRMREYFARNEKCRTCEKRLKCAGGCRVNAMACGGDNLGIDEEACRFHLGGYEERIRETAGNAIKRAGLRENIIGMIPRAVPGEG